MSDPHKTFRFSSLSSTDMIYDVKDDPSLKLSSHESLISSKQQMKPVSYIMSDLCQTFRISSGSSTNMIYDVKSTPILQISSQEPSPSSKPPSN